MLTHTTHQCRDRRMSAHTAAAARTVQSTHRTPQRLTSHSATAHGATAHGAAAHTEQLTVQLSRRSGSRRSGSQRSYSRIGCSQRSSHGTAHGAAAHGAAHGAAAHGAKLTPHSGCSQLRQLGRRQLRRQQFGQRRRLHRLARRQLCAVSALRRERLGQHPLVAPSRNTNRK